MKPEQLSRMESSFPIFSKTDLGTLSHLKWNSLQKLVMVGFTTNGQQYLHVAAVTRPSLQAKLKSDENGHILKMASDKTHFYIFLKTPIFVSLAFCFILKINYKNENWYHCRFHLPGFY